VGGVGGGGVPRVGGLESLAVVTRGGKKGAKKLKKIGGGRPGRGKKGKKRPTKKIKHGIGIPVKKKEKLKKNKTTTTRRAKHEQKNKKRPWCLKKKGGKKTRHIGRLTATRKGKDLSRKTGALCSKTEGGLRFFGIGGEKSCFRAIGKRFEWKSQVFRHIHRIVIR